MERSKPKSAKNNLWLGLALGMVVPVITTLAFHQFVFKAISFEQLFKYNLISDVVRLCVLPNLLVFFIFIWTNLLYSARGVLLATIIWALSVVLLRFLI